MTFSGSTKYVLKAEASQASDVVDSGWARTSWPAFVVFWDVAQKRKICHEGAKDTKQVTKVARSI